MFCTVFLDRHWLLWASILVAPLGRYDLHFISLVGLVLSKGWSRAKHRTGMSVPAFLPLRSWGSSVWAPLTPSLPQSCVWQCLLLALLETAVIILLSRLLVLCRRAEARGKLGSNLELPRSPGILSALQVQSSRSGSQFCHRKSHLWYQSGGVSPQGNPCNPRIPPPQFHPRKGWEDPTHEF